MNPPEVCAKREMHTERHFTRNIGILGFYGRNLRDRKQRYAIRDIARMAVVWNRPAIHRQCFSPGRGYASCPKPQRRPFPRAYYALVRALNAKSNPKSPERPEFCACFAFLCAPGIRPTPKPHQPHSANLRPCARCAATPKPDAIHHGGQIRLVLRKPVGERARLAANSVNRKI